jgi:hypothetical protein
MSARSSAHKLAAVAALGLVLGGGGAAASLGCGSQKGAQGDPAAFVALANTMLNNVPTPGAPECPGEQVLGGATMTMRTLLGIAKRKYQETTERKEFVNPPELDAPAARVLLDDKASERDRRAAAAELAAAPFYLVYIIDHVDVPMALGIKELKRGISGGRALKYDKRGNLQCVRVFLWENDKALSDAAIAKSDRAVIDPAVAKQLRDDLTAQLLKRIAALGAPPPVGTEMAKKPPD